MGLEIEHKYLLRSDALVELLRHEGVVMDERSLIQVYTQISKDHEIRLRKMGKQYIRTTKKGSGLVREEDEEVVDSKLFKLARKSCVGVPIEKSRYHFKLHNFPCCIDVYKKKLEGLVTFEIEFPSTELAESFILPELFQQEVLADVTEDERFKNKNLALYGNPVLEEPIGDILDRLDLFDGDKSPKLNLPSGIKCSDGMRVIFYQLYKNIMHYKEVFLSSGKNEDLHQFRVNIRKTRSLLQCIEGIFEEEITKRFINNLKEIATATNVKRDLDVFGEYLDDLDDLEAAIILKEIERERVIEDEKIRRMMQSSTFERTMQEWSVVLREDDIFFQGLNAEHSLKAVAANALIVRLDKMDRKLSRLDEPTHIQKFHAVRIEFKRVRYMLEYFGEYFHSKLFDETMISAKKMQTLFGTLQDRDVQRYILTSLELRDELCENVEMIYGMEELKEEINNDIYHIRTKILMKKRKLLDKQARCMDELKIYS